MKAHLLYRDRDFDFEQPLPENHEALMRDLALDVVFRAMAADDELLFGVARHVVFFAQRETVETIRYRQAVLQDCLRHEQIVRSLYQVSVDVMDAKRRQWLGIISTYPGGILSGAVELMRMFVGMLRKLRAIAEEHGGKFDSEGFRALRAMLQTELTNIYLDEIEDHLKTLRFHRGVLISAGLGRGNEGINYVLRRAARRSGRWMDRVLAARRPSYTFHIAERDEAGARALGALRDHGINLVANALAQSSDHVLSFFTMLRRELAFYLGAVNLHHQLGVKGAAVCFPEPSSPGSRGFSCADLRDTALCLTLSGEVVGNDVTADGKGLCIITGANQGGKSTFLRSAGLAQLMMQAGIFVTAQSFHAEVCGGVFTHFKREEDATMKSGKFDEELSRMSGIVTQLKPNALVLFNESFAATNEREGAEVARQIVRALLESGVKVIFVTHLFDFAHRFWVEKRDSALFLRAERESDGRRTFKLRPGEPLPTSFGGDIYRAIFGDDGRHTDESESRSASDAVVRPPSTAQH